MPSTVSLSKSVSRLESRNPFAKGLLSIFSFVICEGERKRKCYHRVLSLIPSPPFHLRSEKNRCWCQFKSEIRIREMREVIRTQVRGCIYRTNLFSMTKNDTHELILVGSYCREYGFRKDKGSIFSRLRS